MAPRTPIAADKAVIPAALSHAELMALLGQTGAVAQSNSNFHRMALKGGLIETDDGEIFPPRKDGPALTVRIVRPPIYYNAIFLSENEEDGGFNAGRVNRSDMNGRFARKYDDANEQANDTNPANDLYEDIVAMTGKRGSFKGDIQVQIVPASGQMTGDETVYTLSLSTTSVFEWRGSTRDQQAGSVSDLNFIVKLAQKAATDAQEAGGDETAQKTAILNAMTSLRLGGVIADVYILRAEDEKTKRTWSVVSFVPIHIEAPDGGALALTDGEAPDEPEGDVGF